MVKHGICLVTGATSGIGASFANHFAQEGYDLIVTGRRIEKLDELASSLRSRHGVSVDVVTGDLSNVDDRSSLVDLAGKTGIEVLVNNAGFGAQTAYPGGDQRVFEDMVAVHVTAPMELTRAVIPQMTANRKGAIINVSSLAAFTPLPTAAIYSGTKAFLVRFSECLHLELRDRGIRVQALCPGLTRTDFHRRIGMADEDRRDQWIVRWMDAEEVVRRSIRCLESGTVVCVPGFWNRVTCALVNLLPRSLYYGIIEVFRDRLSV